jgi:hypothetical protein
MGEDCGSSIARAAMGFQNNEGAQKALIADQSISPDLSQSSSNRTKILIV